MSEDKATYQSCVEWPPRLDTPISRVDCKDLNDARESTAWSRRMAVADAKIWIERTINGVTEVVT